MNVQIICSIVVWQEVAICISFDLGILLVKVPSYFVG